MADEGESGERAPVSGGVAELVKLLIEERRRRDEQMEEQLGLMRSLVEGARSERGGERSASDSRPTSHERETAALTKLSAEDDIEAFLTTFERVMTVCGVDESRWVVRLAPQLTGRAQKAYAAMSPTDAGVYSEVKKAILRRYDISEETYRQRFRSAQKKEGEAYVELATRLTDLFKKWMASCSTIESVAEKIVVEQLLSTMPTELRIWLSERKPGTAREAGKLADDYASARRHSQVETPKEEPKKRDGASNREPRRCHTCGQEGHLARNCPKKAEPGKTELASGKEKMSRDHSDKKCYNCHKRGHIAVHCPSSFYCGSVEEIGREFL